MSNLLWILTLLVGAVVLSALARRFKLPSPSLFALGGIALALMPNVPDFSIDPQLALALFVAPVLVDGAFDSSLAGLRENWLPVASLVFLAVGVCTAAVAVISHWLIPAMPWAVGVALGAAVAPPDAAAAIAVLREVQLPQRLIVILEGESLLNDSSALLIYRLAVGAAVMTAGERPHVIISLVTILAGSIALGIVFAIVFGAIVNRFSHPSSSIVLQFIGTFAVWLVADHLHLSGVLVTVTFALVVSSRASLQMPASVRVPSYAVWDAAVYVLNALAFIIIGLQLGPIMDHVGEERRPEYIRFAVIILATVVVARIVWVFVYNIAMRMLRRTVGAWWLMAPPFKRSALVGWCGMRGIVTLAAAMALPDGSAGGPPFPYRDLIVLTAFTVVVGTLILQGLTLRPFIKLLALRDDASATDQLREGRREMFVAALHTLDHEDNEAAAALRREYTEVINLMDGTVPEPSARRQAEIRFRARARVAARRRLNYLRDTGAIGEEVFLDLEAELDTIELDAEVRSRW